MKMDQIILWACFVKLIEPVNLKGNLGLPPFVLKTMMRIHFMQRWFSLSDPEMDEFLYDI